MSSEEKIAEALDRAFGTGLPVRAGFLPTASGNVEEQVAVLEGRVAMLREALLLAGREIDDVRDGSGG
jgi:hypothetical protein